MVVDELPLNMDDIATKPVQIGGIGHQNGFLGGLDHTYVEFKDVWLKILAD